MSPIPSVVLTTYRQPEALRLVLEGYARQGDGCPEVVIADDGSGPETRAVVEEFRGRGLPIVHVWHDDEGFRKTEILDKAVLAAGGDYLIFSDGDCVPRKDFVRTHLDLARPGRFLSGGYLKLPEETTSAVGVDEVRSGALFDPAWLRAHGCRLGRHRLRLLRSRRIAGWLDRVTPTRATWNGHSASTWKEAVIEVNGFDLDMGYGGLDRAFGERLENLGIRGKQIRYRAVCVHLWHERPYRRPEVMRRNREIRARIRTSGEVRARQGIDELSDPGRVDRGP